MFCKFSKFTKFKIHLILPFQKLKLKKNITFKVNVKMCEHFKIQWKFMYFFLQTSMIATLLCVCTVESVLTKSMTLNVTVVQVGVERTVSSVSFISFPIYRVAVVVFKSSDYQM